MPIGLVVDPSLVALCHIVLVVSEVGRADVQAGHVYGVDVRSEQVGAEISMIIVRLSEAPERGVDASADERQCTLYWHVRCC